MAIIAPTIDEFDEPTVMLIIRNLVKWIKTDLVPQINANDIVSATQTSDGLSFEINLIKGDGSQIPVGKITLEDEDNIASGSLHFDDETRMLSGTLLKEDGTPINIPAVEIPGGSGTQIDYGIQTIQFTYESNNLRCVITQNDGTQTTSNSVVIAGGGGTGGNPYPTAISGTVGEDGNITLSMTMSEGNPVTATINMSYFASAEDLEDIQTQLTAIKISTTVSQDSSNVIKVSNAVNGNSADLTLDLSVVGGELILTAEDGTNQATTKVSYSGSSTQAQIIGGRSITGENTLDSVFNIASGEEYTVPSLKYYCSNEELVTCYIFKNLYCASRNTGGIQYCCGYIKSSSTAAQAQTRVYYANKYYGKTLAGSSKMYGIPGNSLNYDDYESYNGYLKVTKCLPYHYCYNDNNMPADLPDIIIKLENSVAMSAKFNKDVYVAGSGSVYLTPLSEISISTEEPTFD